MKVPKTVEDVIVYVKMTFLEQGGRVVLCTG